MSEGIIHTFQILNTHPLFSNSIVYGSCVFTACIITTQPAIQFIMRGRLIHLQEDLAYLLLRRSEVFVLIREFPGKIQVSPLV